MKTSPNILYNNYGVTFTFSCIFCCLPFTTGPALRYDGASFSEYLSDSDSYNDNDSDCGSDDYNNYESNYESDNEEASCTLTSTTKAVKERKVNVTYTLRQENFNDKFFPKDLLNAIQGILSSPSRDMSDDKGSLDCLPIYSFLFSNEKGSGLYNAYDRSEVKDKLVIKIDQDADHTPKFSVADNISEVYGLPGIHECINGQKPLRAVIDIDASKEDMETASVKGWEDILKGLIVTTSTDPSKCSYHILYALALLIDHYELKAFTELVYTITGEKFGKYIDRGLPGQNFNLRLIGLAKKSRVKRILQFSLENGWNELDHARVQPPTSLGLKKAPLECLLCKRIYDKDQQWFGHVYATSGTFIVKCFWQNSDEPEEVFECDSSIAEKIQQENKNSPQISYRIKGPSFPKAFIKFPSWAKYNDPLTATETYEERYVRPLPDEGDIYVGSPWETEKTYVLEHLTIADDVNLLVLSTRHSYSNAVTTRLNLKSYCDVDEARRIIVMDNDLTDLNIKWIKALRKDKLFSIIHNTFQPQKGKTFRLAPNKETVLTKLWDWAKKDVQGIVRALKTDFPELRIKEYHGKSDSMEKAQDFSNVKELWSDVDLVAYTSTLKIGVSCTNPKFEWAFCIFNSYIKTNVRTNQMLFRMRCIKDYIYHIEQRSSNVPVTENRLFQWLLNAKRKCFPLELQNRGIFSDIDSIIWNKDVLTVYLWVAYMLESFCSQHLFGWRMVDFL
ncbi:hypothetical protein GLOIN_2v1766623 [Rhizophagus clarus]|uniref:Replication origin-binding protein domain-containing protein n=1 Tax=Rhizophagus clarus TaxID=94130 RepID=A0A8H3KRZ0_9GLOM|nr:hypothetical protein GLOIN_2v1766623 [Rhizophagus clarus]